MKTTFIAILGLYLAPVCQAQEKDSVKVSGIVKSTKKQPIAAAQVKIYDPKSILINSATTGKDGSYDVTLPCGNFYLVVSANGYVTDQGQLTTKKKGKIVYPPFHLKDAKKLPTNKTDFTLSE